MNPAEAAPQAEGSSLEPPPPIHRVAWWALVCLLPVVTVLLFIPWSAEQIGPSVDVRPELVWSSVASVVLGALALAFPHRWMSFLAFLPTIGALTDVGTVLWPENGSYPIVVKVVVLVLSAVGIAWVVSALGYPAREQQTRWIVAPVAAALIIATLWLPWVVVSGIGQESGQMAAFDLFFKSAATGASGVTLTRLAILVIMFAGIAGSILPLTSRKSSATRLAMTTTLGAAIGLVLLCLWLSIRGDAVRPSDYASGLRVALAGFVLLTLVWNSRLKAAENRAGGEQYPRRIDDSGYIPVIMTGPSERTASTPEYVAPEPSSSSGDQWRTSA